MAGHSSFFVEIMRLNVLICLALAGVTLAIYWPARHFQMIDLDDPVFMNTDTSLKLDGHGLERIATDVVVANWHPVTLFSFILGRQFYGINPFAEHTINIFFHAANAVLLFLVLVKLTNTPTSPLPSPPPSDGSGEGTARKGFKSFFKANISPSSQRNIWLCAFVAGVFAWHPLRVESVAWISERKDVLYVFFMLLSLLCYAGYAREVSSADTPLWQRLLKANYLGALLFFALSFMSKATVVVLPFLLLLLDYWPLGRFNRGSTEPRPTVKLVIEKIPFFALAVFFSGLTFWIHQTHSDVRPLGEYSAEVRIENTILSYVNYLGKFFWPTRLAVFYPYPKGFDPVEVTLAAILLLAISALCILQIRRRPYLAVGWFWYLGTMVPVIGLVQIGNQAMADRHTYIPLIGPSLCLVWLIGEWVATRAFWRGVAMLAAIPLLAACIILTRRELDYWQDADHLFSRAIAVTPDNFVAQSCLATGLEYEGEYREAAVHYRVALALLPHDFKTHYQLAICLTLAGKRDEALTEYRATIAAGGNPNDYVEDMNVADAFEQVGEPIKAVAPLETAIRLGPGFREGFERSGVDFGHVPGRQCPGRNTRGGTGGTGMPVDGLQTNYFHWHAGCGIRRSGTL